MSYYGFRPYVPVAVRREKAAREMAKLAKKGLTVTPIAIEGRNIANTFWGKSWCQNLESYSDYANRLPRGRSYVRNGSVVDLQIERGRVSATVSGSSLYTITVDIGVLPKPRWDAICRDCTGSIGSLVELLQGKLSKNVMERVCRAGGGLFPSPGEIKLRCSCPDWADMCKHVAAVLYGVGARLDARPELLFELRGVDRAQLISSAGNDLPLTRQPVAEERVLAQDDLAALFGIEMDVADDVVAQPAPPPSSGEPPRASTQPPRAAVVTPPARKRTTKAEVTAARIGERADSKKGTAGVAGPEASGPATPASAKPSQRASKRILAVPQPASAQRPAKAGRRVRILAVKSPRWKKPKAR